MPGGVLFWMPADYLGLPPLPFSFLPACRHSWVAPPGWVFLPQEGLLPGLPFSADAIPSAWEEFLVIRSDAWGYLPLGYRSAPPFWVVSYLQVHLGRFLPICTWRRWVGLGTCRSTVGGYDYLRVPPAMGGGAVPPLPATV